MKTLNFVTSNQGKIDNFNLFIHEFSSNFKFEMLKLGFDEIKIDDSLEKTALSKAKVCLELTDKDNVVVTDTGIFIESLNGFPGVNTGFVIRTIGNKGILKLMETNTNRRCIFQVSIAYIDKKGNSKVFSSTSNILITNSIKDNLGFDWDKIVTDTKGIRFTDDINNLSRINPYKKGVKKLVEYLETLN